MTLFLKCVCFFNEAGVLYWLSCLTIKNKLKDNTKCWDCSSPIGCRFICVVGRISHLDNRLVDQS